ncbi:MAG: HAMP domain-containing methyl-accepting chemotaxis protein [Candidatus Pelethousia sp.]|nr:HAMP domain-containing methyl-accepting chemotaxis protein [Candidatus Pelethousia sp.]
MQKQEKQNSIALHKRLAIGFGIVNMLTVFISLLSLITMYGVYASGSLSTAHFMYFLAAIVLLLVLCAVASTIACKTLNTSMVRPLRILNSIAKQLSVGDTSANIRVLTNDEVGKLMQAFKTMLENIQRQAQTAQAIASGDLTVQVEINSEKDVLGIALNSIVENNHHILSRICSTSGEIASEAGQISEASLRLAEGATQQAGSLAELAAAVTGVKSRIDRSAEYAEVVRTSANDVSHDAADGNTRMEEMLKAMAEISVSSANIANVMKVIEDIAFQTNILSLNASVEAARAGEAGKGFAVVADEVRNLATRSAKAAQETADLVESSMQRVEHGTRIAKTTADAFHKIVGGIKEVASLAERIADTSVEQAAGIAAINDEISQVSAVVQENSSASEESTATTALLYEQAKALKEMVRAFTLKTGC